MGDLFWTIILALAPVSELRGAIPYAYFKGNFSIIFSFLVATVVNIIGVIIVFLALKYLVKHLRKIGIVDRFFSWLFSYTRSRHIKKFEKWEKWALLVIVSIPLPFTGGWSGALAAFVFDIDKKDAIPLLALGVTIAGLIVTGSVYYGSEFTIFIKNSMY